MYKVMLWGSVRNRVIGIALGVALLFTSSASAADLTETVNHIRDGDTVEVGGVAIRLQGLHMPELDETSGTESQLLS